MLRFAIVRREMASSRRRVRDCGPASDSMPGSLPASAWHDPQELDRRIAKFVDIFIQVRIADTRLALDVFEFEGIHAAAEQVMDARYSVSLPDLTP